MNEIAKLYNYQEKITSCFLGETVNPPKNIVIQAPTGTGKTLGALYPGINGFVYKAVEKYPQQIIYGVPMRVLASSFETKYKYYSNDFPDWKPEWNARIQTGERPEDTLFEGKLIFATVDQILASFLNIPYGIPKRLDNINAGAFIGSYLIFDEFHLYPTSEMMLTVLGMLYMLKDVTRFTLMTATFSRPMLDAIAELLGASVVADDPGVPVDQGWFSDIKHLHEQRRIWKTNVQPLTGSHIKGYLGQHQTILCICNRVDRAQQIYSELQECGIPEQTDVMLLHSRFYPADRRKKEEKARSWLGKDAIQDGRRKVIIATQVVEVGLDISADILLTECAPAASLIQRAGRCARRGGDGLVIVYQPPAGDKKLVDYAPYTDDGLEAVCEKTWMWLTSSDFGIEKVMKYHDEQALINEAHATHDYDNLLNGLQNRVEARCEEILACMSTRDTGYAKTLIRENNSVRLYIMQDRKDTRLTENHLSLTGFSVSRGRIAREFDMMTADAPWLIAGGEEDDIANQEDADLQSTTQYVWRELRKGSDAYKYWVFAAHPDAVSYDADLGLQWTNNGNPALESQEEKKRQNFYYSIAPDTYVQHISGLMSAYTRPDVAKGYAQSLRQQYQYALMRVAKQLDPEIDWSTLDTYIRMMLALHDTGKLNHKWQQWAQNRHRLFVDQYPDAARKVPTNGTPLAHTAKGLAQFATNDEMDAFEIIFKKQNRVKRGTHAVESAEAARDVIWQAVEKDMVWYGIISAAICHHHTPTANQIRDPFQLVDNGRQAIAEAIIVCGFDTDVAQAWAEIIQTSFKRVCGRLTKALQETTPQHSHYIEALMYYLFVRILRLADQRSSSYLD